MKVCDSWLKTWVKSELSPKEMIHQFTMAGLEVDDCSMAAPDFEGVVVAEVLETKKHPQADKLTVCQINNGEDVVQVVCGASNVRQGLKVALAKPGALLPNDLKIGEAKLRGETSLGMLCSSVELGCADISDGIWELPKDAPVGQDFRDYLALNEHIYSFELTPNRGDCFSAQGLARELAAITGNEYHPLSIKAVEPEHDEVIDVDIRHAEWSPLYCGRKIKNIRPHTPTPLWLKEKIRRLGLRSVHPVVDALNYVMYFLGQPMHAFDVHKISGKIEVREANVGETMVLLGGKKVELFAGTPLITSGGKPIAIAGVMGSEDSCVDEDSSEIFLESAFFNPVKISGVARQYGVSSDAAIRFERGVDPALAPCALEFASEMLISIVGGEPGPITMASNPQHIPAQKIITLSPALFTKRTGIAMDPNQMRHLLERLHFVVDVQEQMWQVTVPTHRFDIVYDVDLVEEVLRLFGYENIPSIAIDGMLQPGVINKLEQAQRDWSTALVHLGYREVINYAFVDPKMHSLLHPDMKAIALLNPISPELSQMRLSLWPGLLQTLMYNHNRQQTALQAFECGVVFSGTAAESIEETHVAGILFGNRQALNWANKGRVQGFYDAKGHIEHMLLAQGYQDVRFEKATHAALHPEQAADIIVGGVVCGVMGALHPRLTLTLDVAHTPVLWQINLSHLPSVPKRKYQGLSKFPHTRRDISFLMNKAISADLILAAIYRAVPSGVLKDVTIFDVYQGAEIPNDMVSLAVACIFQDSNKTLNEQDILSYQGAILKMLSDKFEIKLRDGQ